MATLVLSRCIRRRAAWGQCLLWERTASSAEAPIFLGAAWREPRRWKPSVQAVTKRVGRCIGLSSRADLGVDVGDVAGDGSFAENEVVRDLTVGVARGDKPDHFLLAARQHPRVDVLALRSPVRSGAEERGNGVRALVPGERPLRSRWVGRQFRAWDAARESLGEARPLGIICGPGDKG